eukprot:UC1_evm1s770
MSDLDFGPCDGTWLPYWGSISNATGEPLPVTDGGLFVGYFIIMLFFFVGVGEVADIFMTSIEHITSRKKTVIRDGKKVEILVWNKTVANLSLMALGSSAPEILLGIGEVAGRGFKAGELGPGTIVGSAAFNMLMILAVCVGIKDSKRVQHINVLCCTFFFSVWAYIWLYLIAAIISPNIIEVWEAVVTILHFPVFLFISYLFDIGVLDKGRKVSKNLRRMMSSKRIRRDEEMALEHLVAIGQVPVSSGQTNPAWNRALAKEIKIVRKTDPHLSKEDIYIKAFEAVKGHVKDMDTLTRTIYEGAEEGETVMSVVAQGDGGSSSAAAATDEEAAQAQAETESGAKHGRSQALNKSVTGQFGFTAEKTTVDKDSEIIKISVTRHRKHESDPPVIGNGKVVFTTHAGSAKAGMHFQSKSGVLLFADYDGECERTMEIKINSKDLPYGPNTYFSVHLDSDQGLDWVHRVVEVEICETYKFTSFRDRLVKVVGKFFSQIWSDEKADSAYVEQIRCALRYDGGEEEEEEEEEGHKGEEEDSIEKVNKVEVGQPRKGPSDEASRLVRGDSAEEGRTPKRTIVGWALFFLQLPWKLLYAIVTPPVTLWSGGVTFFFSLGYIGIMTVFIGDFATGLGCTVGLKDSVTAVFFVALGTSVPDMFASKIAAEEDDHADPAIGNVTGSNAVNVFLGIGLSWLLGAAYQSSQNHYFELPQDKVLSFSVVVFSIMAIVWFSVLMLRRKKLGCELGGPRRWKIATQVLFVGLWVLFIVLFSLVAYDIIDPGF